MTTPYKCRECLYFYWDYIFSWKEGHNWCNHWRKEVNPENNGCRDFVLPVIVSDKPYRED